MLDQPDISGAALIQSLYKNYGLSIHRVTFLPLGADRNTAVYRAETKDGTTFFVKLRFRDFNPMSVVVPKILSDQGVPHILAPIESRSGSVWISEVGFYLSVYPFVGGQNAHETRMTDSQWVELGQSLQALHQIILPTEISKVLPREDFSEQWRCRLQQLRQEMESTVFHDPVSVALVELLQKQSVTVDTLVQRAESLSRVLVKKAIPYVLCHADIHGWNMLIQPDGTFFVIDWDTIILAPKERDLMFVASGLFGPERTPEQEESLFYQGYGDQTRVDPVGLAYYRYERVIRDLVEYGEEILFTPPGGENRNQGLKQLSLQFEPHQVIARALRSEQFLP